MRFQTAPLDGKVVIVIGAAGDIGWGIVSELFERGAQVIAVDVEEESLAARVQGRPTIETMIADVSDPSQCDRVIDSSVTQFGRVDGLINAAMVTRRGSIDSLEPAVWNRLIAVNLSAVYFMCRSAILTMRGQGGGVIINMGSIAALRAMPMSPVYAAAKGGVVALSRALALDHASDGIRIFSVNPPAVDTRLFAATFANEPDSEGARADYEAQQPGRRVLSVAEIASVVVYLIEGAGPPWTEEPLVW